MGKRQRTRNRARGDRVGPNEAKPYSRNTIRKQREAMRAIRSIPSVVKES